MQFLYIKSLHIIFVVTWFAGLFYIVRLFIYHAEANEKPEAERIILFKQFKHMERLLWYVITWPSAILTLIFGTWILFIVPSYLQAEYMYIKLALVFILYLYQFSCHYLFRLFKNDTIKYTSTQLRMWNELPTLLLVAIVFLIVSKNTLNMVWGTVGFFGLTILLFVAIKMYKRLREK
ncbi:MAG: CopD family protein [Cyclobacteriaceae bacterium]|nr:CopD family protein [Cyclobacteriaceae bacterium]